MKHNSIGISIVTAALAALWLAPAHAQKIALPRLAPGSPQVAIYYDGPQEIFSEGPLDARQIQNLLGHFGLSGEIIPLGNFRPGQLANYRAAFFVGTAGGTSFPAGFLDEVRGSQSPFAWVGRHLDQLLETPEARQRFGFSYVDYFDDMEFREVHYKGVVLPKEDPDLNLVKVEQPAAVRVHATARNLQGISYPYALQHERFWYFADIPFSYAEEGGRYLVFCDLLHDVLEVSHPPSSLALVRLEDVSIDLDPADLREIADRLSQRQIPFQMAVIPIFRRPAQGIEVRLTDRPSFVDALHYAMARGGAPVLHGITHQYRGITGDDYEFWNVVENRPLAGDSAEYVLERLRLGLGEIFAAGIHPIAFETPHYAATETDYQALKQAFPLFYERTMTTPDLGSIQFFPYPVVDGFGRTVVPENLGYLPEDNPDPQVLVARARALRVVRDGIASFYFHPFLDPSLLEQAVQGIAALGYRFVSLRDFGGGLDFEGRFVVATSSRRVRITPNNEFWRLRVYGNTGELVREQLSSERHRGTIELALEVPSGGWASVECLKEMPQRVSAETWTGRVARWWNQVSYGGLQELQMGLPPSRSAWVLWLDRSSKEQDHNQRSHRAVLETFGYRVRTVLAGEFDSLPEERSTILVVPEGLSSHLNGSQRQRILEHVSAGGGLIADGKQPWLSQLGFQWSGRRIPVANVTDVLFPEMPLRWRPEELVERFVPPEGARQLMVDPESRQVLAVSGDYGLGAYLYLAVPLDQHAPEAVSHYPYFAEYLVETFRQRQSLRSPRLEVYFDPGYRQGADLNRLAAQWRQNGVRIVYAAAWQAYPGYQYDYERLLRVAHQNGISVYAWFVLPQVTPRMWAEHPEWRERTATGADGKVGWRLLMNLKNPDCFRAAMEWMKELLGAHEWDGVNLTELNFDADFDNYLRPDRFIPMNADVRADFGVRAGFDPALLFAPGSPHFRERNPTAWEKFLQYREDWVTELHRNVLEELEPMQRARGWEIVVTMLDSLHSDFVRPALGVNSRRIVELMKQFEFTLQVEDSAEHWAASPERYLRFAQAYLPLVPDRRRLMFDINVMGDRDVTGTTLPSALATGTELVRTVRAAAWASGRAAIYSESTVASQDWALISQALASEAQLESNGGNWSVRSPHAVRLLPALNQSYYVDGRFWPAVTPEGVLVPAGDHVVSLERPWYRFLDRGEMQTRLLNISADLLDARASATGIELRYRNPSRAVILLNQAPIAMRLDGAPAGSQVQTIQAGTGHWSLIAPRGEHSLEIVTTTETGALVNVWSWVSASAITTFGALTTFLMLLIYAYIRVRRVVRKGGTA